VSEGTHSAQRINGALTGDPYLMRVDTDDLQAPVKQVGGNTEPYPGAHDQDGQYDDAGLEMLGYALIAFVIVCIVAALAAFVWVLQQ
jgi:hypothetical protein